DTTIIPFSKEGPYQSRYVAIRNDITARKRMQKEIEESRLRSLYAEKMASLGELTAGIAHELGNPIATIQGRAEMLSMYAAQGNGELHEQALKTAQIIMKLTARMDNILRSMRSFARDGDQDPFFRTPLSVLLDNTIEFGFEKYSKRGVSIHLEPYSETISIECRETQVIQILINLLNNACDAIQDLPEKWIRISVEENDQDVSIHLTDSGNGISQEIQDKIFSQFFTTKSVGKGTGLGLFISKSLARQHRGDLFVDTTSPNTKFVLRLPKRQINDTSAE
ncbi:MAG: sensor histidine kinase, partial [Pseudobdellovibrionaceae bacterium]